MFVIGRANKLLGWFHKRTLPEFFVGKMLVREHSYEIHETVSVPAFRKVCGTPAGTRTTYGPSTVNCR